MFGFMFASIVFWIFLFFIWTIPWKGYALWLAARNGQPWWFVILLLVNTLAILEIIYIFFIGRPLKKKREADSSSAPAE